MNSKGPQTHRILNMVNRVCCQIRIVHLRIHPQNIQKYLDEYAMKADIYDEKSYPEYTRNIGRSIFLSGKAFRRRAVSENPLQQCLSFSIFYLCFSFSVSLSFCFRAKKKQ